MKNSTKVSTPVLFMSSYPPRECGIATFTQDLATAFNERYNPEINSRIIALNDSPTSFYGYDGNVVEQITATDIGHYVSLAKKLNKRNDVKIINIQHEFGIFGGDWGDYLIPFLQVIEKPVVVSLHSVIPNPNDSVKNVMNNIAQKSSALVVMNGLSKTTLISDYGIPQAKIQLIPHGIPSSTYETSVPAKERLGLQNRIILSTFGLLSPNKGVEYAIRALPSIVKKYPNVLYMILGITHPILRRHEGEKYRNSLIAEVKKLGLQNNVKFYDKYMSINEIVEHLKATDIYVCSAKDMGQSVSGTITYALGCGRPVVSSASLYAKYIINNKNGILVRPKKPGDISRAVLKILKNHKLIRSMSRNAYEISRPMTWPNVAASYLKLYQKVADINPKENKLPEIKLDHLIRLTDEFGMLQFAKYSKPQTRYGYTLDDNARALIASIKYYQQSPKLEILTLIKKYLEFIKFVQRKNGSMANAVSYDRINDRTQDEDVQGRGIWALGYAASADFLPEKIRDQAEEMLTRMLTVAKKLESPRAIAFAIIGFYHYLKKYPQRKARNVLSDLAKKLSYHFAKSSTEKWSWFEEYLTYSNSKLSESMFYAFDITKNKKYLDIGRKSLNFLKKITFKGSQYWPIGQNGWYFRQKERSYFDQQPEDTASMVQTKLVAYRITGNKQHLNDAINAFGWFLGKNHLNQNVYDEATGGCCDGIHQDRLNLNQGAESTLSYLMARLDLEEFVTRQSKS